MKLLLGLNLIIGGIIALVTGSSAHTQNDCLCIKSEEVQKYCLSENANVKKNEYQIHQEAIAQRDIQRQINHSIEADIAKDATARSSIETEDFAIKELDGKVYSKKDAQQIGASANNYQGILRIAEQTKIKVECLRLKGKEATVYTNQHFVRYVPDRKDESPHELITNIIHRETWVFTEQGWRLKFIEELERGNTYLDGKLYNP